MTVQPENFGFIRLPVLSAPGNTAIHRWIAVNSIHMVQGKSVNPPQCALVVGHLRITVGCTEGKVFELISTSCHGDEPEPDQNAAEGGPAAETIQVAFDHPIPSPPVPDKGRNDTIPAILDAAIAELMAHSSNGLFHVQQSTVRDTLYKALSDAWDQGAGWGKLVAEVNSPGKEAVAKARLEGEEIGRGIADDDKAREWNLGWRACATMWRQQALQALAHPPVERATEMEDGQ